VVTRIDHVIVATVDLDATVARFAEQYRLPVLAEAAHPAWGTRNAILPVGYGQFIELLAIADRDAKTPLVHGLQRLLSDGQDRTAGVCVRPPDLDAVATRLSLQVMAGERHEPDRVLRFRRTVVESDPQYPFFIAWDGEQVALDSRYGDPAKADAIAWVEVGGDGGAIRGWIDDDAVPIRIVEGRRGPRRFALRRGEDELVIE
jgi:hypothetical protein